MRTVKIKNISIGKKESLVLISGPCVIENEDHTLYCAEYLVSLCTQWKIPFIFKASYDKANRTSIHSFRGPGLEKGLAILRKVKERFNIPIFTDVHSPEEAACAADVCDVIQIPAFLCRQTDLIIAAGKTKAVINVKKGQFIAPWDVKNIVEKLLECGKEQILLTERGSSFGYHNLVSDMRSIPIMQSFGFPVLYDGTHSAQLPGGLGDKTGGEREFIPTLTCAAIAAGCNALYIESHPNPPEAKSDAATVLPFSSLPALLEKWLRLYEAVRV